MLEARLLGAVSRRCKVLASLGALVCGCGVLAAQTPILISPALPTTSDSVFLVVEPTFSDVYQAPTIAGNVITLQVGPLIPAPFPITQRFPLRTLAAGSYTVKEVDNSGNFLSASVFQVTLPATDLNLLAGRFVATTSWFLGGGTPALHQAPAVQVADESGYFWFFDAGTIEVSVKVLDGTAINGHYWVFIASSTNVPFNLTVTDTLDGHCNAQSPCPAKTYSSSQGTNQNFIDLNAFSNPPTP